MSHRFTTTKKWADPWFCSLTKDEKLFWIFLLDNCDHAGIWDVNWAIVSFHFGELIYDQKKFEGRIIPISGGTKWFIPKFIAFQYKGDLNKDNRAHQSVITILKREGLWPLPRKEEKTPLPLPLPPKPLASPLVATSPIGSPLLAPSAPSPIQGAKDKDKDKATDQELVKDKATDISRAREYTEGAAEPPTSAINCEYCGWIKNEANHKKCHYCFHPYKPGEHIDNHRCPPTA